MVHKKTEKKVLKVIRFLKQGKNLSESLDKAKMMRGHFYSARDAMLRDGNQIVRAHVQGNGGLVPTPKKPKVSLEEEKKSIDRASVLKIAPKPAKEHIDAIHAQALAENQRLQWAEELIAEIKGTQQRQSEILKKLLA